MANKFLNRPGTDKVVRLLKEKLASKQDVQMFEDNTKKFVTDIDYFDISNDLIFEQDVVVNCSEFSLASLTFTGNIVNNVNPSVLSSRKNYIFETNGHRVSTEYVEMPEDSTSEWWLGVSVDHVVLAAIDLLTDTLYIMHSAFGEMGSSNRLKIYQPSFQ